ncbi:Ca-activated chloride channel family protein [Roseivivax lentus]|uniref:Ca-activated chloride channel family protein n=1 Tax=Roseivivax lentus TaxID=633194 RepID=A0A1N7KEF5_9RHOB|nr:VWA domain-containing protein [Roseivivax lentus]SIS59945.1 Ca-activated chloride channel family protein [Roseivivax lentus]
MFRSLVSGTLALSLMTTTAAAGCYEDAMIVFDASGSMAQAVGGTDSPTRIAEAQSALRQVLPMVPDERPVGLLTYGPGTLGFCENFQVRLAPEPHQRLQIQAEIDALSPLGDTPLARAVELAAEAMSFRDEPAVVVLVTDGRDTCGSSVCRVAEQLAAEGADLTVHVIGFRFGGYEPGQDLYKTSPGCLSAFTGGHYLSAQSLEDLVGALHRTLTCPLIAKAAPVPETATRVQ